MGTPPLPRRASRLALALLAAAPVLEARKFFDDDPLIDEPRHRHTEEVRYRRINDYYDYFLHTFGKPGERNGEARKIPAQAVNTLGEPMNGSWWEQRHYYKPMSIEALVRGPGNSRAPSTEGPWTVVAAKSDGVTPGFEIEDVEGRRYVLKFDPLRYPKISTAPDAIVSRLLYAVGYHVPENYIVYFRREQLHVAKSVRIEDRFGRNRPMTANDVAKLLMSVPRDNGGQYCGGASLYLPGRPVGRHQYYGTRKDDPNDTVPHEHRREQRGLSVFCAWVGHDDSRSINSLDVLIEDDGIQYVKHYLIDFGSTLGSASYGPNSPRSGFEYVFDWDPAMLSFFTLGLNVPYWARAKFPKIPSAGLFEHEKFDAEKWVPEYSNPAFLNRLPDDEFWAAKQVMAFTDDQIRALVKTGEYWDLRAEDWIAECLIRRRDKIGKAFLEKVLPLDKFAVEREQLAFTDLGIQHKLVPSRTYKVQWSLFDNDREEKQPIRGATTLMVPAGSAGEGGYLAADIHGGDPKKSVTVYLRKRKGEMQVVGVDRTR